MSNYMVGGLMLALVFFGVAVGVFMGWMCRSDQTAIAEGRLKHEQEEHAECRSHRLAEAHEAGKLRHSNVELQARLNRAREIVYESSVIRHASCYPQLRMLLDPEAVARDVDRYFGMATPALKISVEDFWKAQQQAHEIFKEGQQPADISGKDVDELIQEVRDGASRVIGVDITGAGRKLKDIPTQDTVFSAEHGWIPKTP